MDFVIRYGFFGFFSHSKTWLQYDADLIFIIGNCDSIFVIDFIPSTTKNQ